MHKNDNNNDNNDNNDLMVVLSIELAVIIMKLKTKCQQNDISSIQTFTKLQPTKYNHHSNQWSSKSDFVSITSRSLFSTLVGVPLPALSQIFSNSDVSNEVFSEGVRSFSSIGYK